MKARSQTASFCPNSREDPLFQSFDPFYYAFLRLCFAPSGSRWTISSGPVYGPVLLPLSWRLLRSSFTKQRWSIPENAPSVRLRLHPHFRSSPLLSPAFRSVHRYLSDEVVHRRVDPGKPRLCRVTL